MDRDRGFESCLIVLAYLDADTASASLIAGGVGATYLRIGDGHAAIDRIDDGEASAARFEYETDLIATDPDELAGIVFEERGVTLEAPPPEVASLLETVRDEEDGHLDVCDEADSDDLHRDATDALEAYLIDLGSEIDGAPEYARYDSD